MSGLPNKLPLNLALSIRVNHEWWSLVWLDLDIWILSLLLIFYSTLCPQMTEGGKKAGKLKRETYSSRSTLDNGGIMLKGRS